MKKFFAITLAILLIASTLISFTVFAEAETAQSPETEQQTEEAAEAENTAAEEEAEEEESYADYMFGHLGELSPTVIGILAILLIGGIFFFFITREQKTRKSVLTPRLLAVGAMCIALSFLLSQIRLFRMPQGGSITPASGLPLLLFAYSFGFAPGAIVCVAAGLLQLLQGGDIVHPIQVILDYPLAFGMYALAGLFIRSKFKFGLQAGTVLGMIGRYACAVISGAVFFGMWAPEGMNVWVYSLGYNISYIGVEAVLTVIVASIPGLSNTLGKAVKGAEGNLRLS
ncbi:MAG: energy-coupled thiamine transporter ThiT [Oscillospiraceae bacterium]|jgi:thiamine transporter|nr:energy-coupled thiamine transporter ThiT [Oscillospiraceae bacterium]